jgi:hypothetical protein
MGKLIRIEEDEYVRKILTGTSSGPKTPQELARIYDIPIAACFERIRILELKGYLRHVLTLFTREGKALRFYERTELKPKVGTITMEPILA